MHRIIQKQSTFSAIWKQKENDLDDIIKIIVDVKECIIGIYAEM